DATQTKGVYQPKSVITAGVGDTVTLHCFRLGEDNTEAIVWYKQKVGHGLRVMVTVQQDSSYEDEFKSPRFRIEKNKMSCHLKITNVQLSDEAMYHCGYRDFLTRFGNGTFLAVTGDEDVKVSVSQSGVLDSVPAGASVTLQCSVLSESRAAELQVLWFRAAPPQSHPQIIYTHHNSGHQCESGSSTHTCVYNFSKNILSHNDTGTYYCAVAVCGKIIFGNGTQIQLVGSKQTKGVNQPSRMITAAVGDNVTLHCFELREQNTDAIVWYKQIVGQEPRVMVTVLGEPKYEDEFKPPKFSIKKETKSCHLKISHVQPSDEAMYYCGFRDFLTHFGNGTFLAVTGDEDVKVSVFQSSMLDSVPAGASVTLQCSVLSESRAAELQVLWFRAAPPQSHPQIIYTHHNSGHQCESGSPTHTCVYNFSKNILSLNDTGTYYCAVAACGKIIFGNGTRVQLADSIKVIDVNQPNPVITAAVGDNVTLECFRLGQDNTNTMFWYKQKVGHRPRIIVTVQQESIFEGEFKSPRFSIEKEKSSCHLKISHVEPSDEAMYYCGFREFFTKFGNGTFLAVNDDRDVKVSVSQSSVSDSVPAGASVTLQCSVLSESRAAELQVLWFRAAPPQSHPQIIYTHHNSGHQCESGSPTHTCVYNFSKNILSHSDTGTYYCAVAVCGKIIFGNGTRVQLEKPVDPVMISLTVALGVCMFVIFVHVLSSKGRSCEHCSERYQDSLVMKAPNQ
ncbi:signal-regulatory protein beta-1-like, partial [Clarias magur]